MDYREARVYLDSVAKYGNVLGLENMRILLDELGNPQDRLRFVHISGTNGKGSALAYISTVLKEAGYCVGRYISPTLFSYRERIQVNEHYIEKESLARHVCEIKCAIGRIVAAGGGHPTIFEVETALAFLYFAEKKCDIVVLETGMGGDTDATNIIRTSILEVLMPISMDHMEFLGNSLEEIAAHKAGIIKPGTMVVSAPQAEEAMQVLRERAADQKAELRTADPGLAHDITYGLKEQVFSYKNHEHVQIHLAGTYQINNAVTALDALDALRDLGFAVTEEQLKKGFAKTVWRGRFSVLSEHPLFIIDGAHNRDGAKRLRESIEQYLEGKRLFAICGVFRDKEYKEIIKTVAPCLEGMITIQTPDNPRALPAEELAEVAGQYLSDVQAADSIEKAVETAFQMAASEQDAIVAFGSLSFLGIITSIVERREKK